MLPVSSDNFSTLEGVDPNWGLDTDAIKLLNVRSISDFIVHQLKAKQQCTIIIIIIYCPRIPFLPSLLPIDLTTSGSTEPILVFLDDRWNWKLD